MIQLCRKKRLLPIGDPEGEDAGARARTSECKGGSKGEE